LIREAGGVDVVVAVVPAVDVAAEEGAALDRLACGEEGDPGESVMVVVLGVVRSCFSLACVLVF
jgi:hypothetical protein